MTRSRAFALWLALLALYFLILPTAAETPDTSAGPSALGHSGPAATPSSRYEVLPRRP